MTSDTPGEQAEHAASVRGPEIDLISRALRTQDEIEGILARKHLDLAQAYEQADRDAVREVIIRHTAHAKQTLQRGIERAGGQL